MSVELTIEDSNFTGELELENKIEAEISISTTESNALDLESEEVKELHISDGAEIYKEVERYGTTSYEDLDDLPSLDGVTIIRDVHEKDPTVPLWAKTTNKPVYSSEEVGVFAISIEELEKLWNNL